MMFLTGCPDKPKQQENGDNKKKVEQIDKKAAGEFLDNYLRFVLERNIDAMKSFYSKNLKSQIREVKLEDNPHPVGYKIVEDDESDEEGGSQQEGAIVVKVHIYNAYNGAPYFSDETFKYTLIKEEGEIVIDKVQEDKSIVIDGKEKSIVKRDSYKVKGEEIIKIGDLPEFVTPKKGSLPEQKFQVPKKQFGPCALSSDGKKILITSVSENSFIGMAEMEDSSEAFALAEGSSQGQEQGGQAGQNQEQQTQGQEEKKPTVIIKPIDLYFKSKIQLVSFSPDNKKFLVENIQDSGKHRIILYTMEGEILNTIIDKQFRADVFSLSGCYFVSPAKIIFKVTPDKNGTDEEQKLKGIWEFDIDKDTLKQIQ